MTETARERESNYSDRFEYQESKAAESCELHNRKRRQRNKQDSEHRKWCCYCNYRKVYKVDVDVAMTILARDYKGFGSGQIPSNGVIIEC